MTRQWKNMKSVEKWVNGYNIQVFEILDSNYKVIHIITIAFETTVKYPSHFEVFAEDNVACWRSSYHCCEYVGDTRFKVTGSSVISVSCVKWHSDNFGI